MDIYQALIQDHNQIKPLLEKLVHATEVNEGTKQLITQIRDLLVPHSRAEEAVLYNSLREIDFTKSEAMHGYKEHITAETILHTLEAAAFIGIEWTAAAKSLRDAIFHHIEEEEGELFQIAREVITEQEAVQMAKAFELMKPEIREEGLMKNTMDLVANLMPRRFTESFKSTNK